MPHSPPYRIERTRNKHSRAVLKGRTIVVRLARNLTLLEEKKHIEELLHRMNRVWLRESHRTVIDPFRPLLEGANDLLLRVATDETLHFALRPGTKTRAHRTHGGWVVDVGPRIHRRVLHRFLWKLFAHAMQEPIERLVWEINASTLQVEVTKSKLRYARTQWGSCSVRGAVSINPALLFVPLPLLRYVIVHELAHRLHRNHSRAFWRTVELALPESIDYRKQLRQYRICTL